MRSSNNIMESILPYFTEPLSMLAQVLAENTGLRSELELLQREIAVERSVLNRMLEIDNSLPISLLASLLSIGRRKHEDTSKLTASEERRREVLEHIDSIRVREDILMADASSSDGPSTFAANPRRWQSLRHERSQAEAELRARERQVVVMRERLATLQVLDKQAWGAVGARQRLNRSRPSSRKSDGALSTTFRTTPSIPEETDGPARSDSLPLPRARSPPPKTPDSLNLPDIPDSPIREDSQRRIDQHITPTPSRVTPAREVVAPPVILQPAPRPKHLRPNPPPGSQQRISATSSMLTFSHSSFTDTTVATPMTSQVDLPEGGERGILSDSGSEVERWPPGRLKHSKLATKRSAPALGASFTPPPVPPKSSTRTGVGGSSYPAAQRSSTDRHTPTAGFEFSSFAIAPLQINPHPGLNDVPFPSPPSPTASSAGVASRHIPRDGPLKKLGRGIFRGENNNRNYGPSSSREAAASGSDSKLEPLVEGWVLEQMDAPPPSASEIAAYYSETDSDARKRNPFGRLKLLGNRGGR